MFKSKLLLFCNILFALILKHFFRKKKSRIFTFKSFNLFSCSVTKRCNYTFVTHKNVYKTCFLLKNMKNMKSSHCRKSNKTTYILHQYMLCSSVLYFFKHLNILFLPDSANYHKRLSINFRAMVFHKAPKIILSVKLRIH